MFTISVKTEKKNQETKIEMVVGFKHFHEAKSEAFKLERQLKEEGFNRISTEVTRSSLRICCMAKTNAEATFKTIYVSK